ncbi:MAG TPA: tetratricopeptide repeat protein [Kofleriaceae bacterium]|nr:tetratricopeptide repeat protein [Kofleriaceae bacterium]
MLGVALAAGQTAAAPDAPDSISSAGPAPADRGAVLTALGADELHEVERAVATIAAAPAAQADPDVLFAAGRACEDKLLDPARAIAIYQRIVAEHPAARVAAAASRRIAALSELIGPPGHPGHSAGHAAALAQLVAHADAEPAWAVLARGEQLAGAAWPGAPAAALWLADWLRRSGRLVEAQAHYARVVARWPESPQARAALRGGAGCALEAHDWSLAEALARRLPATAPGDPAGAAGPTDPHADPRLDLHADPPGDPIDAIARADLLRLAARGRRRDLGQLAAWLAISLALVALLGSLAEATLRSPRATRRSPLRPPIEAVFLLPVVAVLIGVAVTAHRAIAPAVTAISLGGLALTWLSGATLEQLRTCGRAHRLRSLAHVAACLTGVAGLVYLALIHGNLIDLLVETIRFGPEG